MQRMKLHTQGVKLPPLGSSQDVVLRQYVVKEAELEAKRAEFQMLTLLTNPTITEDAKWREWKGTVKNVWQQYVGMLFHTPVEIDTQSEKDKQLIEYYQTVVKSSSLKMFKDKDTGKLTLTGLDTLDKRT